MTPSRGINRRHPYDRVRERTVTDESTGCAIWQGATNWGGYGRVYDHRIRRYVLVHRLAYETVVGPIPEGLTIDHLCRVRRCVNPEHLEPVTVRENLARKPEITHCKRGHEFTPENTYLREGRRYCRACSRERYRSRTVAAAALTTLRPR